MTPDRDPLDALPAEEPLHEIPGRVEVALRGSGIGIWELELTDGTFHHGRVVHTNVFEQLGYGRPESPPDLAAIIELIHPEDRDRLAEAYRSLLAGEIDHVEVEQRLRHRDGSYRTVLVRGVAIRDATGKPTRVIGVRVDITDRKRIEAALRQSEERFRLATEALAGFLYDWDPITNHVEWFGGTEEVLGFRLDEVAADVGWFEHRVHPDDLRQGWAIVRAAFESGAPGFRNVYRVLHRDGHYVDVADRSRIIRDEAGRPIRVLGGVSDISERRRLEREREALLGREREARAMAEAAARARNDMLGIVSHDLGNPLSAIAICASALLESQQPSPESVQAILRAIQHSAESTNRLIRDLLDVTSIEAGHLALEPRDEAPAAILTQAAEMFSPAALACGIAMETHVAPDLPVVRADAQRVLQGLANLQRNALKFTEPGGCITLRAERDPAGVRFVVEDTGAGIAAEDLPYVFDRYWQRGRAGGRGTGLGLAIVRGIVEAHGGQLRAESTPGKGSQFSFTIPIAT